MRSNRLIHPICPKLADYKIPTHLLNSIRIFREHKFTANDELKAVRQNLHDTKKYKMRAYHLFHPICPKLQAWKIHKNYS